MDAWFWVWLGLAAIFSIAELFTAGFFLLPFGIGAALAAILNAAGVSVGWQWVAFIGGSFAALLPLRRLAERITHEPSQQTGGNRLIGKHGVVIETLDHGSGQGRVRVDREEWRADAPGYEPLPVGAPVIVVRVEGTHLVVKAADADAVVEG